MDRVVLDHFICRPDEVETCVELTSRGCYVEFDLWGMEVFPTVAALTRTPPEVQAASLAWFIAAGMTDRILLSHDTGHRQQLRHHGGYGLAHLLRDLSPQFHAYGITDETLDRITVQNPRRLMPYRPVGAAAGAV